MSTRRVFLKTLAAGGIALGMPSTILGANKIAIPLEKVEKLKKINGSVILKIKEREILFVRDSDTTVRALDPTCSHRKCTVEFQQDSKKLACPCHGSKFTLDGDVLNGPAEKPLNNYETTLLDGRIILTIE